MPSVDRIRELQIAAARVACEILPGSVIKRVVLIDEHGRKIDLPVPPCPQPGEAFDVPETPMLTPGWSFTDRHALYDGRVVAVSASRVKLLRVLAEATAGLTAKELARAAFGDRGDEESARFHVRELRKELKTHFNYEGDPIPNDSGYRLVI